MPTDSRGDRTREQSWNRDEPWRRTHSRARRRGAHAASVDQDDPAYRYGYESASRYMGRHWDEVEPELRRRWTSWEHRSASDWDEVKHSVREAYYRAAEDDAEA